LWASLALALAPLPALATNYYVSPSGNDSNAGTTPGAAWRTISKANNTLRGGDVVNIAAGIYGDDISPANNGTAGARITYIGNPGNPNSVQVGGIDLFKDRVTIKGVSTPSGSGALLQYFDESRAARFDSLVFCNIGGGVTFRGAKGCMVAHNTFAGGGYFEMDHGLSSLPALANSARDTLRANKFNFGTITWKGFVMHGLTEYCLVDSNQFTGYFAGGNVDVQGRYLYGSFANTFRDNKWTFEGDPMGGGQYVAFAMRDSTVLTVFERDTMLCGVQSGAPIGGRLINAGVVSQVGKSERNRWTGCYYKSTSYMFSQDVLKNSTIENSVFASLTDRAIWFLGDVAGCTIRNNTFYSGTNQTIKVEGDIRAGGTTFFNNIFYCPSVTACSGRGGLVTHGYTTGFTQDYNLFFSRSAPSGTNPSTMSIIWGQCSGPGTGQPWYTATGNDGHSRWGSPLFVDSTFAGFNPHLRSGSYAIGMGQGGVDVGAYPFGSTGTDQTAPSAVTNLGTVQIADRSVILGWTAPGDDGSVGTASSYDLRYSVAPITSGNFASAIPVPVQPLPAPGGTGQTYVMLGLSPGTSYYFALKASDENGNVSALSNVLQVQTTATDLVSPASIQDLGSQ
jgi:hypothetical protein